MEWHLGESDGGFLESPLHPAETPPMIYARVFGEMKPRTPLPGITVEFCAWANANSTIRLHEGRLEVRITDALNGAPAEIHEALARILLSKLYRKPVPAADNNLYRRFLNRKEMRRSLHLMRQIRGRKFVSGPQGGVYNLAELFEELNHKFFGGLMAMPELGWSRQPSRVTLGHYDPSHHAIILSKLLDRPEVPRLVVEYVMYHEMLHLQHPVDHRGARRCVHTREFRQAEKHFPALKEAKEMIRRL
ncbi:MAG: M48 family peptidase [Bryobacteraceae bacterium]